MLHLRQYKPGDFDASKHITNILQHANQLSRLTFTTLHQKKKFCKYPIDEEKYCEILKVVQNRFHCPIHIKLTIEFNICFIGANTHKKLDRSESLHTLDMVLDS